MTTARQIITSAMRKIGAITKNESPSADEAADGLEMLNDIISSWSNDSTKIYARTLESFSLSANDGAYTIGSGADFNTARPVSIVSAYVRSGSVDYPLEIVTDQDYALISFKEISGIPEFLNYDYGYTTGNIKLYPLPASAYTLFLLSEKVLSSISSLDTVISLPPGWERALKYNLSIEMAPEYGQPVAQEVLAIAVESRSAISSAIMRNKSLDVPRNLNNRRNIYSGYF